MFYIIHTISHFAVNIKTLDAQNKTIQQDLNQISQSLTKLENTFGKYAALNPQDIEIINKAQKLILIQHITNIKNKIAAGQDINEEKAVIAEMQQHLTHSLAENIQGIIINSAKIAKISNAELTSQIEKHYANVNQENSGFIKKYIDNIAKIKPIDKKAALKKELYNTVLTCFNTEAALCSNISISEEIALDSTENILFSEAILRLNIITAVNILTSRLINEN